MQNCLFNLNLNNITFSTLWVQITVYSVLCENVSIRKWMILLVLHGLDDFVCVLFVEVVKRWIKIRNGSIGLMRNRLGEQNDII
jgi:hypothetical protein